MLREKELRLVVTFHTTAGAMGTEKLCREAEIPGKLITVPRCLSSDCGLAFCTGPEQRPVLEPLLRGQALDVDGFYELPL